MSEQEIKREACKLIKEKQLAKLMASNVSNPDLQSVDMATSGTGAGDKSKKGAKQQQQKLTKTTMTSRAPTNVGGSVSGGDISKLDKQDSIISSSMTGAAELTCKTPDIDTIEIGLASQHYIN